MWAHEAVLVSRLGKDDGSMAGKVVQRPSSGSRDLMTYLYFKEKGRGVAMIIRLERLGVI